jgi:glyoxylase-like metal-dependent hydrolase (beta-lactamase superfamily II)
MQTTTSNLHPIVIPTPFPVGPVNVYLLDGPELALVDTGPNTGEAMATLRKGLAAHGYAVADIRHLVITHAHPDHYGLAAQTAAESKARVYSHRFNLEFLAGDQMETGNWRLYYALLLLQSGVPLSVLEGMGKDVGAAVPYSQPVGIDVALDDGNVLTLGDSSWEVIHTPGHARGHICLYNRESGDLLSGDHLLRDISSNPILEPPLPGETERPRSLVQYLCSLERVAVLEVAVAWPGHGAIITDHRELIAQRVRFHRRRADQIAALLAGRPQTAYEIATILFSALQGMQAFLAVSEVIGHLDILEQEGRVASGLRDGILFHALTGEG